MGCADITETVGPRPGNIDEIGYMGRKFSGSGSAGVIRVAD
jgi:hypothetical protein